MHLVELGLVDYELKYNSIFQGIVQGRNEGCYFVADPIFAPILLIDPRFQKGDKFWSLIPQKLMVQSDP